MERDPVCGMTVDPQRAAAKAEHAGNAYYFCCKSCAEKFRAEPVKYLHAKAPMNVPLQGQIIQLGGIGPTTTIAPAPLAPPSVSSNSGSATRPLTASAVQSAAYICPMDPEVQQDHPGACPKCGMALEPRIATAEEQENPELGSMRRRLRVGAVLTVPILAAAMSDILPGAPLERFIAPRTLTWIELALATPVVLWGGWPFFVRGWQSVVNRSLNMFTLVGLGVAVAYFYSVIAALVPKIFPFSFRDAGGQIPVYFEAASVITTLVLLGQVLELKARNETGAAIRALLGLVPKTARLIHEGGSEEDVPLDQVRRRDRLRVRPGEKIPVDGVVLRRA